MSVRLELLFCLFAIRGILTLGDLDSTQKAQFNCLLHTCTDLVNRIGARQKTDWLLSNIIFPPVKVFTKVLQPSSSTGMLLLAENIQRTRILEGHFRSPLKRLYKIDCIKPWLHRVSASASESTLTLGQCFRLDMTLTHGVG